MDRQKKCKFPAFCSPPPLEKYNETGAGDGDGDGDGGGKIN